MSKHEVAIERVGEGLKVYRSDKEGDVFMGQIFSIEDGEKIRVDLTSWFSKAGKE